MRRWADCVDLHRQINTVSLFLFIYDVGAEWRRV